MVRQAKKELMEANLRPLVSVAKCYLGSELSLLDLVQEGNIGLMKAVDRFQYRCGFVSPPTRRGGSGRRSRGPSRTTPAPSASRCTWRRRSTTARWDASPLRRSGPAHGVPARKVRLILESSRKPLSLETPIGDDSELGDFLEDKGAESPNDNLITQDLTLQWTGRDTLLPKEKEILRLRFGIGEAGEHTLEEVGRRFSVTRERMQIETKALRKLRDPLRGCRWAFVEN